MSGGVDSSVAAAMMVEAGHEVVGMTMSLYEVDPGAVGSSATRRGRGGTCCSPAEVDLARRACEELGIPHYTVDERDRFRRSVIDDFAREYAAGRTPNPCARCNEHVKFAPLLERARGLGASVLVTGHYARVRDGGLYRGVDRTKDQSYFLFAMGRATLESVRFPLGEAHKDEVRERARSLGLPNWDAPDSQELCFVPDGDHAAVVERRVAAMGLDEGPLAPGPIVDEAGETIGHHAGIHRLTVGQRRGLGLSSRDPKYVLRVLPDTQTVVAGPRSSLGIGRLWVEDFRALADLSDGESFACSVQYRHGPESHSATATIRNSSVEVDLDAGAGAAAPGQAVVLYRGDQVLGGGWLDRAE
jgi:tRNA-specific 2-thiouridylase